MTEQDSFFRNSLICNKAKQILSQINTSLIDSNSLAIRYEELSVPGQLDLSSQKTVFKARYRGKVVFAEVYNFPNNSGVDIKVELLVQLSIMKSLSMYDAFVEILGIGYLPLKSSAQKNSSPILVLMEFFDNNFDSLTAVTQETMPMLHWEDRLCLLKDIVSSLLFLERYHLAFSDLSSRNIFWSSLSHHIKFKGHYQIVPPSSPTATQDHQFLLISLGKLIFQLITGMNIESLLDSNGGMSLEQVSFLPGCPEALKLLMLQCMDVVSSHGGNGEHDQDHGLQSLEQILKSVEEIDQSLNPPQEDNSPSNNPFEDETNYLNYSKSSDPMDNNNAQDKQSRRASEDYQFFDARDRKPSSIKPTDVNIIMSQAEANNTVNTNTNQPTQLIQEDISEPNKDEIFNALIADLQSSFRAIDQRLNEKLDLIENMHIIEETKGINENVSSFEKKMQAKQTRQSIETLFSTVEDIKKQLVFLYLYCDIDENEGNTAYNPFDSTSNQQNNEYLSSELNRREDNYHLLASLQEILNNDPPTDPQQQQQPTTSQGIYDFYRANSAASSNSDSNRGNNKDTMKRKLSLLRQDSRASEPQSRGSFGRTPSRSDSHRERSESESSHHHQIPPLPPKKEEVKEEEQVAAEKRDSKVEEELKPAAAQQKVPTGAGTSVKDLRKSFDKPFSYELPPKKRPSSPEKKKEALSHANPRLANNKKEERQHEEDEESEEVSVTGLPSNEEKKEEIVTLDLSSYKNNLDSKLPSNENPHQTKTSVSARLFGNPDVDTNDDGEAWNGFGNTNDSASNTASNNRNNANPDNLSFNSSLLGSPSDINSNNLQSYPQQSLLSSSQQQSNLYQESQLSPSSFPSYPPAPQNRGTGGKIPGIVVGRKNSLVVVENKMTADFKFRKQSLYRSSDGTSPVPPPAPITTSEGTASTSTLAKIMSGAFPSLEVNEESDNKGGTAKNNIPFSGNSNNNSNNNHLKFIQGRVVNVDYHNLEDTNNASNPIYSSGPNVTSPQGSVNKPVLPRTPIEKASDFITRVRALDAMYLNHHLPDNPANSADKKNKRKSAASKPQSPPQQDLINGNISYLHNNTFTGTLHRMQHQQRQQEKGLNSNANDDDEDNNSKNEKAHLTHALTSFLKVIEKCQTTSTKAKHLMTTVDQDLQHLHLNTSTSNNSNNSPYLYSPANSGSGGHFMTQTHSSSWKSSPTKPVPSYQENLRSPSPTQLSRSPKYASKSSPRNISIPLSLATAAMSPNNNLANNNSRNFFDDNQPNNLSNSFQSLYNVNNNANAKNYFGKSHNNTGSTVSSSTSPIRAGVDRRTRYSIHQEKLSHNKSPVTFSFSPTKKK